MLHPVDHAADRRRILEDARAAKLVEAEPPQGVALIGLTPNRAADLRHREGFFRRRLRLWHLRLPLRRHPFHRCRPRRLGSFYLLHLRRLFDRRPGGLGRLCRLGRRRRATLRGLGRLLGRLLALVLFLLVFLVRHGSLPRLDRHLALAQDLGDLAAAPRRHRARAHRAAERVKSGLDHVVRVRGADRFRHHVLHPQRLENGAHRTAGDDAGAGLGRTHDYLAGAVAADDVVMQCAAFAQGHAHHGAARLLGRLADRLRHLARLARAVADAAFAVADDDDGGKAEAPATLNHLGDAVDADELLDELALVAVAAAVARRTIAIAAAASSALSPLAAATAAGRPGAGAWCACHEAPFLEGKSA